MLLSKLSKFVESAYNFIQDFIEGDEVFRLPNEVKNV